jgi:hypothetical protein
MKLITAMPKAHPLLKLLKVAQAIPSGHVSDSHPEILLIISGLF